MSTPTVETGRFSLMIRGETLSTKELEQGLGLAATSLVRKGELLNRLPRIEAADDLWVHEIPLSAPDDTDSGLNDLLEQLLAHRTFLLEQAKTKQVTLRLYVRSSRAHITYSLMPETLQKLNEIGLPLELSSLSWGEFGV